jgi:hypothetical protein
VESKSDAVKAIQTPSSPCHKGKIKIRGMKKNAWRDNVSNKAEVALPTA